MKRALIIRHAEPETLAANFTGVLEQYGFQLEPLNIFESCPAFDRFAPPPLEQVDLVVALGGPMSANDDYPAIHHEREYLRRAMALGKPVLGICLGAQIMAAALGGMVEPSGGYQFGLRKLCVTAAGDADPVFGKLTIPLVPTLHGECFSIPQGVHPAGGRVHALPRRELPQNQHGLPLRQLLRIPVRAAAHPGGIAGVEPGTIRRLHTDGRPGSTPTRKRPATCGSLPATNPTTASRCAIC